MSEQIPPQAPEQGWGPPTGGGYQGGDPKAQAKAEKAYRKATRPWYKKKRFILLGLIVLLIILVAATSGGGKKDDTSTTGSGTTPSGVSSAKAPAQSDSARNITVNDCKVDKLGDTNFANVNYTINNPTSKSSNYIFQIEIIDSTKAKVGSAGGIENNVLPGRPSTGQAGGSVSSSAVGPFTCQVGDVTRLANAS